MNVRAFRFVSPLFSDFVVNQNLLRTLTEGPVKASLADTDLKLLLSTVKEGRVCHPANLLLIVWTSRWLVAPKSGCETLRRILRIT